MKNTVKILALAAATLAGLGSEVATPEKATGSSAYFHVNTSNDTVRIENVVCKYCDGEYGKGKGRNATFLKGVSLSVDFTMNAENEIEDDPIDHYIVNKEVVNIPSFTIDVGALAVGTKFEVKAVTRNGSESKPFRVNFDIARVPVCFTKEIEAEDDDDRVLYIQPEGDTYSLFQSIDGTLKLRNLLGGAETLDGVKFNCFPEIRVGVAMDSSTAKVLVGTLFGLGPSDKVVGSISRDSWKKLGEQKIGRLANADLKVNLEGDIIGKWNPEKKIWVNVESVIGADIVYSGQVSFRFPQTLYLVYVSGGLSGETHFLLSPKTNDQWHPTCNILGQPLIEGFVEGGVGIDCFRIAVGGELGLILNTTHNELQDWGWGGQFYWAAQLLGTTWGSQGVRKDDTSIDEANYYFQYWWWHNGAYVDSWSSEEQASAALNSAGPTKANARKLAASSRLLAAAEPVPCNPQPALAMRGGVDVLCFLTNATARSASDQSMLVCRTGTDGAWGAVETPWDDGTADLSPSVGVAADGMVIAAWVNLKGAVGEPTHLTDLTRKMEIAVGVRNPSTGAWTCRNLTADDQVDFSPRVAVSADGSTYVAWCANADNAFYGSNTVVKCAAFAGGAWGSVTSLGKVGSVNGLAAACHGANGAIVCTVEDGDAHWVRCFEVAGGRVSQSATVESASWAENPDAAYDAAGVAQFHWLQEGVLRTKSGFAAGGDAIATGAAEVTVPRDAAYLKDVNGVQGLVWQDAPKTDGSQNGVMLMARGADGKWQVPATLWLPEERARTFSGAYAEDGTLRLAYESVRGSRDDQGVMRYGAATLKVFELDGGVDVSVTANEIGVDGGRLFYGAANEFFATIHNLGRTDAVNVPIRFVAAANGTDFEFYSAATNIAAGGSVCVTSEWTVAQGYTNLCFKVLLDPDQTLAERNRANNAAEWRPAAGSLAIADERFVRETRNVCQVNAKVVTDGALVIPEGTVVEYRRGGPEGALLGTDTLGEIVPGKGYSTGCRWDMSSTTFADAWETVYLAIRGNDHAMTAVRVMTTLDTDGDGAFDGEEEIAGTDPQDPGSKPDDVGGGAGGGDEPAGAELAIELPKAGWHEVSFCVLPEGGAPGDVFAPVADKIGFVTQGAYNWSPKSGGTLAALEVGKGYWVQTLADDVKWTVSGTGRPDVEISLKEGWNLIGYPLASEGRIETVLASALATGNIRCVYSGAQVYPGTLATLVPGKGYWVYATSACKIVFNH